MQTVIIFLLILSLLVVVHEGGHFLAARAFGIKVYEFAVGFPPRLIGLFRDPDTKKWRVRFGTKKDGLKETVVGNEPQEEYPGVLYSINILPLGGFVRIKGENGEHADEADSFGYQPAWQRIIVLAAGVIMNFLLAAVVLGVGFMVGLPADSAILEDPRAIVVGEPHVVVQQVQAGSPADLAGLDFGDKIVSINGDAVGTSDEVTQDIRDAGEVAIEFAVIRGDVERTVAIIPTYLDGFEDAPRIGVVLADAAVVRYPWYIAIPQGFVAAGVSTVNIVLSFAVLLEQLILGNGLAFEVAGPVGIASIVGDSARLGINYLLNVTAMISLSLAVINILPIPALDGGRILFVLIESITRRKVPMKYEQLAHTIGFVLLMGLIVVITWRDIVNLF